MKRNSLQTNIIIIFVLMMLVILFSMSFFSYIKIKQVYMDSLHSEFNNAYIAFSNSITNIQQTDYINFIKYFAIHTEKRHGILTDSSNNILNSDLDSSSSIVLNQYSQTNTITELEENFLYKNEIKDSQGNVVYNIYVEQNKEFINAQLATYLQVVFALITIFLILTLIISFAMTRNIVRPINKLIKSLDDIISGNSEVIDNIEIKGPGNEVYDLVEKFKILSNKLSDNVVEISNQKAQIETILLHMSDGVMAFDIYGNLIYQNPAAIRLLNVETKNKKFDEIFKKLNVDVNLEKIIFLQDLTSSEKMLNINEVFVNIFFETFEKDDDVIGGVIVLIQDITKQVKLDDMRKEFVANVSHELKTPITTIKGYSEALAENELEPNMEEKFLNVISTEAQRMARLVSDLLQLSKFDINKMDNKKVEFDLGDLVKKTVEKMIIEAEKRGHNMECHITSNVPLIYADKDGIEQVVLNIISNSIKYTPDYGDIKIYVGFVYNDAYIKVIDNGIGIPKEDLERVFERFYRVDKARSREQGGTGLGLSIAKEIIERNGGSIDIISDTNQGTEVIIRLPVAQQGDSVDKDEGGKDE